MTTKIKWQQRVFGHGYGGQTYDWPDGLAEVWLEKQRKDFNQDWVWSDEVGSHRALVGKGQDAQAEVSPSQHKEIFRCAHSMSWWRENHG
jgi:hypothetical protein